MLWLLVQRLRLLCRLIFSKEGSKYLSGRVGTPLGIEDVCVIRAANSLHGVCGTFYSRVGYLPFSYQIHCR